MINKEQPPLTGFKVAAGPAAEQMGPHLHELVPNPEKLPFAGKRIMITGGTRDFGGALVVEMAKLGAETIVIGYSGGKNKEKWLQAMEEKLAGFDTKFEFVPGDITTSEGRTKLGESMNKLTAKKEDPGKFDILVLNAASSDDKLNVDANVELVDQYLPMMRTGGKIVLPQSHPGHFQHTLKDAGLIPAVYEGVAKSKNKGEAAIKAKSPDMAAAGIKLDILVLPALPDTRNVQMFTSQIKRAERDLPEEEKGKGPDFVKIADALGLPQTFTNEEAAEKSAAVIAEPHAGVHTELFADAKSGWDVLPKIYGPSAIYVDLVTGDGVGTTVVTEDRAGRRDELTMSEWIVGNRGFKGHKIINTTHPEGHFAEESGLPLVLPAHKVIRLAYEGGDRIVGHRDGANLNNNVFDSARLLGFKKASFKGSIKPDDKIDVTAEHLVQWGTVHLVNAEVGVNGVPKAIIEEMALVGRTSEMGDEMFPDQLLETAAQTAAIEALEVGYPAFVEVGSTYFTDQKVEAGSKLHTETFERKMGRAVFSASSKIVDDHGNDVATIRNMRGLITSKEKILSSFNS